LDFDFLEVFQMRVAGGGHGAAQCPHQVGGAVGVVGCTKQQFVHWGHGTNMGSVAAWEILVGCFQSPVPTFAGCFISPSEGGAQHDGVGAPADGFVDVSGSAQSAVGDDVDVAPAGLVHVVTAGFGDIGDSGSHRYTNTQST